MSSSVNGKVGQCAACLCICGARRCYQCSLNNVSGQEEKKAMHRLTIRLSVLSYCTDIVSRRAIVCLGQDITLHCSRTFNSTHLF